MTSAKTLGAACINLFLTMEYQLEAKNKTKQNKKPFKYHPYKIDKKS